MEASTVATLLCTGGVLKHCDTSLKANYKTTVPTELAQGGPGHSLWIQWASWPSSAAAVTRAATKAGGPHKHTIVSGAGCKHTTTPHHTTPHHTTPHHMLVKSHIARRRDAPKQQQSPVSSCPRAKQNRRYPPGATVFPWRAS